MPNPVLLTIKPIYSNLAGFSQIAELASIMDRYKYSTIKLDMRQMGWCDGNMCAPLGAIFYRAGRELNDLELRDIPTDAEKLLCKNGFLTNYGRARLTDTYGSTIQYRRFEPQEDRVFSYYFDEQFRNKAIPEMSKGLHKKFLEGLMEIFSNAVIHSETKMGIFVCGQYFHRQRRLDFTITDLGIGIRQNLLDKIGLKLPAKQAIDWAMEGTNTTKRGRIPGGLGLKLLREFIRLNHGKLQIVSDTGYWEQHPDGSRQMETLSHGFPGTVVNIEINTADQNSYILSSEKETDLPF